MEKRGVPEIVLDVKKLQELMTMCYRIGDGYTLNQRIDHHEDMVKLLKELREADGGAGDLP